MPLIYLLLITVVMFGTFVASIVKTIQNNSISKQKSFFKKTHTHFDS